MIVLAATAALVATTAYALTDKVTSQWLSAGLLKLERSKAPGETTEEFEARVRDVADAIVAESRGFADGKGWTMTELAAAAGVIWHGETLFDRRIQSGEGHPNWTQDNGKARCGMQLHVSGIVPQEVWEKIVGEQKDTLHLCAQYGLRVVVAQARQCGVYIGQRADRNRVAKMLASYASGGKCVPTDRDWQRADQWNRMMATRPDHEKKTMPGYRRAAPAEIPQEIVASAREIVSEIGAADVLMKVEPGFKRTEHSKDGRLFVSLVEKHAEGKIGVSVFVKE